MLMNMSKNVVVIPIYKSSLTTAEVFSIQRAVSVLEKHDVCFVGPKHLYSSLQHLAAGYSKTIQVITFADRYFRDIAGYNSLMMSLTFYQKFAHYQYLLIAQTDSLVFSDELDSWSNRGYSYTGAPWFEGFTTPTLPLRLTAVGNGGFSLRRVQDFIRVLEQPRIFRNVLMESWPGGVISTLYRFVKDYFSFVYRNVRINVGVNEDLFWGLFVPRQCTFFRVPEPMEALSFAFEAHPEEAYVLNQGQLPFGCHAWQRYSPVFWERLLAQHNIRESIKKQ